MSLVQYFPSDLRKRMDALIREKVRSKQLRPTQGVAFLDRYSKGLEEYTYYNYWGVGFKLDNPSGPPVVQEPRTEGEEQ